jgi:6-pyruvoyltetrahydropterin/6-carboxytetrahydropterin synthase
MTEPPPTPRTFISTKTYCHNIGLSCAFRQWRAESHCKYLHGYALEIGFKFEADELDERNWVVDFGSLKSLKGWLEDTFDHKTLVAEDDPKKVLFHEMHAAGIIDLVVLPALGCEKFAEMIFDATEVWLLDNGYSREGVRLLEVEVREHAANSAICRRRHS